MDFITEYVSSVDSLRGEVNIDLSISGPWINLTRNGSISIEKSNLYMLLLDKPIIIYPFDLIDYIKNDIIKTLYFIFFN